MTPTQAAIACAIGAWLPVPFGFGTVDFAAGATWSAIVIWLNFGL
jgi:hypothetical protein